MVSKFRIPEALAWLVSDGIMVASADPNIPILYLNCPQTQRSWNIITPAQFDCYPYNLRSIQSSPLGIFNILYYFHSKDPRSSERIYNEAWLLSYQIVIYRLNYGVGGWRLLRNGGSLTGYIWSKGMRLGIFVIFPRLFMTWLIQWQGIYPIDSGFLASK